MQGSARARDHGLAFLAGVSFAAVPAAGPFIALFTWLGQRLQVQRADRLWWSAATLLSLPFLATGHLTPAVETLAQVLAAWLLFRSATALRRNELRQLAQKSGIREGTAIVLDARPLDLDDPVSPLVATDAGLAVEWTPGAVPTPLAPYLAERAGLLLHPPRGAAD